MKYKLNDELKTVQFSIIWKRTIVESKFHVCVYIMLDIFIVV